MVPPRNKLKLAGLLPFNNENYRYHKRLLGLRKDIGNARREEAEALLLRAQATNQAYEARLMNQQFREIAEKRLDMSNAGLRKTVMPVVLHNGTYSDSDLPLLDGMDRPLGIDDGMVRLASEMGQIMAHSDMSKIALNLPPPPKIGGIGDIVRARAGAAGTGLMHNVAGAGQQLAHGISGNAVKNVAQGAAESAAKAPKKPGFFANLFNRGTPAKNVNVATAPKKPGFFAGLNSPGAPVHKNYVARATPPEHMGKNGPLIPDFNGKMPKADYGTTPHPNFPYSRDAAHIAPAPNTQPMTSPPPGALEKTQPMASPHPDALKDPNAKKEWWDRLKDEFGSMEKVKKRAFQGAAIYGGYKLLTGGAKGLADAMDSEDPPPQYNEHGLQPTMVPNQYGHTG